MSRLGEVLDFMPNKVTKQKRYNNTMLFRMESEIPPVMPIRLKLEINCFEHFTEMGLVEVPFSVGNKWFSVPVRLLPTNLLNYWGRNYVRSINEKRA